MAVFGLIGYFMRFAGWPRPPFLLGLVLGLFRKLDNGSIWGCIGFHGGLVGIWFVASNEFVEILPTAPEWLICVNILSPNPIGGFVGVFSLCLIILAQLKALDIIRFPLKGALKASSSEDMP